MKVILDLKGWQKVIEINEEMIKILFAGDTINYDLPIEISKVAFRETPIENLVIHTVRFYLSNYKIRGTHVLEADI